MEMFVLPFQLEIQLVKEEEKYTTKEQEISETNT
jgi:hypothetical protein